MRTFTSSVRPSGHLVIVRLPAGAQLRADFLDEADPRDITSMVAELLATGALDVAEAQTSGRREPDEQVTVAHVTYIEQVCLEQMREQASFTWVHIPTGESGDFPLQDVLPLIVRGVTVALTEGIAAEAADVPDTPAGLANES